MNSIYTWGSNRYKQTSTKDELHVYSPACYSELENLAPSVVAAGDSHTLVLTDYGEIYSFGRGIQGELGHPEKMNLSTPKIIEGLKNEVCSDIACGSITSFAITASGKVYNWGLVLIDSAGGVAQDNPIDEHNAASGELTGLAQDQTTTFVAVDEEARGGMSRSVPQASRQLRDIVKESTERWMLANDGADEEYLREMKALGYQNEEVQEMMEQRGREYHGMLRLGCKRVVQPVPVPIRSVSNLRVLKVAAGYAHCMLLTDAGRLYAAGYNDRGQLGLGHRISTSEFKWVDFLAGKFVVQVTCGQQHTLCRAIDRTSNAADHIYVGSRVGCDVYSWGNGMLGQLGLGMRGTSKGRLLPTLIPSLQTTPISDIGSGHMFSVVVTSTGEVFSFGHAEYNQHGTGGTANRDYTDPFHFFVPRQVPIIKHSVSVRSGSRVPVRFDINNIDRSSLANIVSVSCGSNYTIAIDIERDAYSWGWNESGVLGHGIGYFSSAPMKISGIGASANHNKDSKMIVSVATGAKHVIALTTSMTEMKTTNHYRFLRNELKFADVELIINDNQGHIKTVTCHKIVLAARCPYFMGYLKAANQAASHINPQQLNDILKANRISPIEVSGIEENDIEEIDLTGYACANPITITSLLDYIYLDKIQIIEHKKPQLMELAKVLCISSLSDFIEKELEMNKSKWMMDDSNAPVYNSTFAIDMQKIFVSGLFSDVVFTTSQPFTTYHNQYLLNNSEPITRFYAHKAVLMQLSYFDSMFSSRFKENATFEDGSNLVVINLDHFAQDNISSETFYLMLMYAYTGLISFSTKKDDVKTKGNVLLKDSVSDEVKEEQGDEEIVSDEVNIAAALLVAADCFGFSRLAMICEKELLQRLRESFPHTANFCLNLSKSYGFARLERHCIDVLRMAFDSGTSHNIKQP